MRTRWSWGVWLCVLTASWAHAYDVGGTAIAAPLDAPLSFYAEGEYVLTYLKNAPAKSGYVTTFADGTRDNLVASPYRRHGSVGLADTRILYGQNTTDYGRSNGLRLTAGGWFLQDKTAGAEIAVTGVTPQSKERYFDNQEQALALAYFNSDGRTSSGSYKGPDAFSPVNSVVYQTAQGNSFIEHEEIRIKENFSQWGVDGLGMMNAIRNETWTIDLKGGFTYLRIDEGFKLDYAYRHTNLSTAQQFSANLSDVFKTSNNIIGGKVGVRLGGKFGRFLVDLTPTLALGANVANNRVEGHYSWSNWNDPYASQFAGTVYGAGGFMAQPSNTTNSRDIGFVVIPGLSARIGVNITKNFDFNVGYMVSYINRLARPGDQMDPNINPSQNPVLNGTGAVATTTPYDPQRGTHTSSFFEHGMTIGLTVRF